MDADDLREHYLSGRYLRNRLLLLAALVLVAIVFDRLGLVVPGAGTGAEGRALVATLVAGAIVLAWLVVAVIGLFGLVRWLRD